MGFKKYSISMEKTEKGAIIVISDNGKGIDGFEVEKMNDRIKMFYDEGSGIY